MHTPGPWHATIKITRHPVYDERANLICTVERDGNEEDKANARLIAAAPELLAALEAVAACWHDFGRQCDQSVEEANAHRLVLAAIAKAKSS